MNDSLNSQQSKPEPKWQGMSSLMLGVVTAIPVVCTFIYFLIYATLHHVGPMLSTVSYFTGAVVWMWFYLGGWIFPAAGFVLGIMGLKYTKKRLAVTGIILSMVGFVNYTFLYFFWSRFG
jgi:hypothetical protein